MFELCLFDLDDTLIRTSDFKDIREKCVHNQSPESLKQIVAQLGKGDRLIYSQTDLLRIRAAFPDLKLGVFTRSPRCYAELLLKWAYPKMTWDIVVAYEDVKRTKPRGEGIDKARTDLGIGYIDRIMLVGDTDVDVKAAYNAGCWAVLDKGAWPGKREYPHWEGLKLMPDAIISSPDELLEVLKSPVGFLPELERALDGSAPPPRVKRFDKINHFIPKTVGGDTTAYPIHVCGRSFSNYASVSWRKKWHDLTQSISDHKDAEEFPEAWIDTIRAFIQKEYPPFWGPKRIVVSVVPHRPGREPRLENLLKQLADSFDAKPMKSHNVTFEPQLLKYLDGVKSQHNDHLGNEERFINVRDHLRVRSPQSVSNGTSYLVMDDVTTTGASLIYARKILMEAGAEDVKCLSMAKNVGNIL